MNEKPIFYDDRKFKQYQALEFEELKEQLKQDILDSLLTKNWGNGDFGEFYNKEDHIQKWRDIVDTNLKCFTTKEQIMKLFKEMKKND